MKASKLGPTRALAPALTALASNPHPQVVDPTLQGDNDQIFFGATVTLCWDGGEEQTYTIVGVDEADVARGRISWISPLARTLIKAREGDSLRFQTPAGVREIDILEVVYQAID